MHIQRPINCYHPDIQMQFLKLTTKSEISTPSNNFFKIIPIVIKLLEIEINSFVSREQFEAQAK